MAITASEAVNAVQGSKGIIKVVANRLGCSRQHVYNLMDKFVTVKEAVEEEREGMKDFTEGKLFQQIDAGNMTAIIFYLKTQAKDRGYVERQEHHIKDWRDEAEKSGVSPEEADAIFNRDVESMLAKMTGHGSD